ncbi:hypothetical protein [Pantanalinema sp. GBBB05]|uniref:hypothetical protein n=1 Tax=Pantanalinema sp. GBBB05 TaxID=2604139 RepID=UPI001D2A4F8C|nr:hypothetical protein [Pantanalinema sp. GBBB05]
MLDFLRRFLVKQTHVVIEVNRYGYAEVHVFHSRKGAEQLALKIAREIIDTHGLSKARQRQFSNELIPQQIVFNPINWRNLLPPDARMVDLRIEQKHLYD